MKLSKTAWLILGIGIFVIALGSLYMVYSRQGSEEEQLSNSLLAAQQTLSRLTSERADSESTLTKMEDKLAQAELLLHKAKAKFPGLVESTDYAERLFNIADGCDLAVTEFTSLEPADQTAEAKDVTYFVTSFSVKVEGEVTDILDFINAIATSEYFTTATIELVDMDIPEEETEEEEPSASIGLVIYGYKGE